MNLGVFIYKIVPLIKNNAMRIIVSLLSVLVLISSCFTYKKSRCFDT